MPAPMTPMADSIVVQLVETAQRLIELGLGYLTLDRASSTLSTGERQRVALSRAVRNRTTGVLYVLDEPSIGLHPANVDGLLGVIRSLLADGNSVVVVDHDTQVLRQADWLIEIGPGSGRDGGTVIATGTLDDLGSRQRLPDRRVPHRARGRCRPHPSRRGRSLRTRTGPPEHRTAAHRPRPRPRHSRAAG